MGGLFDELDLLQKSFEENELLHQVSADDEIKCSLGLLGDVKSESSLLTLQPESLPGLNESLMDNPFFEEFIDLDQLFPELAEVDTLNVDFAMEQGLAAFQSDICHTDVVILETDSTGKEDEDSDVLSTDSPTELSSPGTSVSDIAQSPESIADGTDDEDISRKTVTDLDNDQSSLPDQTVEEITVLESSDPLTLLTQKLIDPSTPADINKLTPSTLTVDLDELLSISASLGVSDSDVSSWADNCSEEEVNQSDNLFNEKPQAKRKRACLSESSITQLPVKKAKRDTCIISVDKRTIRRLKNNIASKHARANRKQKELELFQKEEELEKDNAQLQKQIKELEVLTSSLRKVLVEKLSGATLSL